MHATCTQTTSTFSFQLLLRCSCCSAMLHVTSTRILAFNHNSQTFHETYTYNTTNSILLAHLRSAVRNFKTDLPNAHNVRSVCTTHSGQAPHSGIWPPRSRQVKRCSTWSSLSSSSSVHALSKCTNTQLKFDSLTASCKRWQAENAERAHGLCRNDNI